MSLTAVGTDGAPYFRGRVPAAAPGAASRVTFDAKPGPMELRVSVEGSAAQILDSEVRKITVPDLTSAQTTFGTPEVFRARTVREFQQLKADADAVPMAGREFSRTDRLLIRAARVWARQHRPDADGPAAEPRRPAHGRRADRRAIRNG